MQKNILYEDFVTTIINILKEKKIENVLKENNIEEDKKILHNFFLKPILNLNNNNLNLNWSDEQWIQSMKEIRLGLLSFLYKNKASLYKIYSLIKDDKIKQCILLEKYKNVVNNVLMVEKMTMANKFLLEENIFLDELQNKNYYLMLNIKNIKDPKYISYVFDMLSHKDYRKTILKYIIDGTEKIDLKNIIENKDIMKEDFIEKFLKNLSENNIYKKIIYFIMSLNFNGEILMKKEIYNKIQTYINQVILNSSVLNTFFSELHEEFKQNTPDIKYKNYIKIIYLPENIVFTNKKDMKKKDIDGYKEYYNKANHIDLYNIDYDKIYKNVFIENNKYYFNKNDIIQRIVDLISLLIEYIIVHYFESKEEKINTLNSFFANNDFLNKFNLKINKNTEFINILKNIKENGLVENIDKPQNQYDNKQLVAELIEKIKNNVKNNENINHFYEIVNEFIYIFKNLDNIDINLVKKEDFNICYDLIKKLTEDITKLKNVIYHIIDKENFTLILNFIESKNILKINKVLKEKFVELTLKAILEILNIIKSDNQESTTSLIKFLCIIAKAFDYAIFYLKKLKHNQNIKKHREIIKKQVVLKK